MGKYEGYLIVSDMDATLLTDEHEVCERNQRAIREFIKEGGRFSIATGRVMPAVRMYLDRIHINAPAILHNGAKIYDFENEQCLFCKPIEEERKPVLKRVHDELPFIGLEVYTADEETYVYQHCEETKRFKERGYDVCYELPEAVWDKPWIKWLLVGEKEMLDKYEPIYRRDYDKGYCVRSGDKYLDIVSGGVSKGKGMLYLAQHYGIAPEKVIAVGDNMNDIDMLKKAGIGVAVSNAEDAVKAVADAVVCSNNEGAIADIIEKILK